MKALVLFVAVAILPVRWSPDVPMSKTPEVQEECGCSKWVQADGGYTCERPACPTKRGHR